MSKAGSITIAIRVLDTGADGGLTTDDSNVYLACGDGKISLAGDWKYKTSVNLRDFPPRPVNMAYNPNLPTVLYNAMLKAIIPFAVQGAIWYQGESNADRAYQYRELLPLMITDWRTRWGYTFPFYIVQIANYMDRQTGPEASAWAELREAQSFTQRLEKTGLACIIDIGEADDIHPKNKQEVGRRLGLLARALTYGEKVEYSGPQYLCNKIEGRTIRLRFSHTESGLKTADGSTVKGFYIAGNDHLFHEATARIEGNEIVVQAQEVDLPVAVRYAWANNPVCNVYNGAGLPMVPFRTDDWPGLTSQNQ